LPDRAPQPGRAVRKLMETIQRPDARGGRLEHHSA